MPKEYYIIYTPLTFNFMDALRPSAKGTDLSPLDAITFLTNRPGRDLSQNNFLDYLTFDPAKKRETMVETFALETLAATYVGNQIARLKPQATVIHTNDQMPTIRQIITQQNTFPKAVFITCISANFPTAALMSIILNFGKIPVILGGIHVSTRGVDVDTYIRQTVPYPEKIAYVKGPGDAAVIRRVLTDLAQGGLRQPFYEGQTMIEDGLWKARPNVRYPPDLKLKALTKIPVLGDYLAENMAVLPFAPYLGCPYACKFCSIYSLPRHQRRLTLRSQADLLAELTAHARHPQRETRLLFLLPDNLLIGRKFLVSLLDQMIEKQLRLHFIAQVSIDIASDRVLLKKLRHAGATHFFIGFESLDMGNLAHVGKHIVADIKKSGLAVTDYYHRQIRRIQSVGISIHGAFILGLPHDYFNSVKANTATEIIRFCKKTHIGVQPATLTDLPGSEFFAESLAARTDLYGPPGTMSYFLSLCLTDLSETNRKVPSHRGLSPLSLLYMGYLTTTQVGATRNALKNAMHMLIKAFFFPTRMGRKSLKYRLLDALHAFALQLYVSLYKDVGEKLARSTASARGSFERLYDTETNTAHRTYLYPHIRHFFRQCQKLDDEN